MWFVYAPVYHKIFRLQSRINPTKWQSRKKLRRTKSVKNVESKTAATKHRTIVFYKLLTRNKPSPATMAHLTASDKAFIVSQHYAGKTAAQIQRNSSAIANRRWHFPLFRGGSIESRPNLRSLARFSAQSITMRPFTKSWGQWY